MWWDLLDGPFETNNFHEKQSHFAKFGDGVAELKDDPFYLAKPATQCDFKVKKMNPNSLDYKRHVENLKLIFDW